MTNRDQSVVIRIFQKVITHEGGSRIGTLNVSEKFVVAFSDGLLDKR